jgi:DNA-binding Lrp family transcriptional regulator
MAVGEYILIQTGVGQSSDVAAEMRTLPGVSSADATTGPYDVIARVEAHTLDELGRFVVRRIHPIDGVTRTLTCPIVAL